MEHAVGISKNGNCLVWFGLLYKRPIKNQGHVRTASIERVYDLHGACPGRKRYVRVLCSCIVEFFYSAILSLKHATKKHTPPFHIIMTTGNPVC